MTSAQPLLVATRNPDKRRELEALLAGLGRAVVDLDAIRVDWSADEDALEVHDSFEANALAKARHYYQASGGMPTLADDSGLEVTALGGQPGVRSKRWANATGAGAAIDDANNAKLLVELTGAETRTAQFTCVVAYVDESRELVCRGAVRGRIAPVARGVNGFGYDPLFEADELGGRTFAEVSAADKDAVSHRARAVAAFVQALTAGTGPSRR